MLAEDMECASGRCGMSKRKVWNVLEEGVECASGRRVLHLGGNYSPEEIDGEVSSRIISLTRGGGEGVGWPGEEGVERGKEKGSMYIYSHPTL